MSDLPESVKIGPVELPEYSAAWVKEAILNLQRRVVELEEKVAELEAPWTADVGFNEPMPSPTGIEVK